MQSTIGVWRGCDGCGRVIKGFSANLNCLYADLDEQDRCRAAVRDGFRCVEMWAPPGPTAVDQMIDTLGYLNLSVASVNTSEGPGRDAFGVVGDPSLTDWWRENFGVTLDFARRAGVEAINVLVGGRRPNADRAAQRACLVDNVGWALRRRRYSDPVLLLEPLNGADRRSPLLQNVEDVLSVLGQLGDPPGLRMLFDAYHLFQEEDDLIDALRRAAAAIGHVQLADFPGRAEPGSGELPVSRFLTELVATGYEGWVGLEYFPTAAATAFSWLNDYADLDDRVLPRVAS